MSDRPARLSVKDRKIIRELNRDSRQSFSSIGNKVGLPKNVVAYRVKRLVDDGVITLFCATIDRTRMGYMHCRIFLKLRRFSTRTEDALVSLISKQKGVHYAARLDGPFDFCVIILARSIKQIDETHLSITRSFGDDIIDKEISIATRLYYLPFNYLYDTMDQRATLLQPVEAPAVLDKRDLTLINTIKENARIPMIDLMKRMGMSPQAIRNRTRALQKEGILTGFNIRLNPSRLGLHHFHTCLKLADADPENEKRLINHLCARRTTTHLVKGLGRWDLEFESVLPSYFELHDLLRDLKDRFPDAISHVDTHLVYKVYPINTVTYE